MDGIKVKYGGVIELMEYVGPCYNYGVWIGWPNICEVCGDMQFLQTIYN
jgi:hypothetical protein